MKLTDLRKLVVETIKEQQEADLSRHPNRSVSSFFGLILRHAGSREKLADLYDIMINDPDNAEERAEDMGLSRGVVRFHQKGLMTDPNLPTGQEMLSAALATVQARKDAAEKRRAQQPTDTRTQADYVYPRDSKGKIIGRAD